LNARTYEVYRYPFRTEDELLVLTLGIDITERQEAEEALHAAQGHLQESEQNLRFLASQLISAQEEERKRISRDLHDVLGQSLLSVKLEAKAIARKLEADPHPQQVRADFDIMHSSLDRLIETVRRLSRDLSPAILEDLGITAAIRHLVGEFARHHGESRCSLEIEEISDLFSLEDQVNLYRIFQEALNNIGKYAQAAQVSVVVSRQENGVSFLVEDKGRGFDVARALTAAVSDRGLGLASMQERVRMLGGELQIWSEVGKGSRISFIIPSINPPKKPVSDS
jgi:signal transduction histidine kinase